jgi:hypothetical protein
MKAAKMPDRERFIRASEVGQYAYCARAWWLNQVQGVASENQEGLEAGKSAHKRHGRAVIAARRWQRLAWLFFVLALGVALLLIYLLVQGLL